MKFLIFAAQVVSVMGAAPTGAAKTLTAVEDNDVTIATADFGFADGDGGALKSVKITILETAGALKLDGTDVTLNQVIVKADLDANKLKLTPVANANGSPYTTFSFKVTDSADEESLAAYIITINITAAADLPTGANKALTVNEDTDLTIATADFGFADVDSNTLKSVKITTLETAGALKLDGTDVTLNQVIVKADLDANKLKLTPVANANGSPYTTFAFKVMDSTDAESAAAYTITINVTAVADLPTGAAKTLSVVQDTDLTIATADFGFADGDSNTLKSVKITTLETAGALKLDGTDCTLDQVIVKADLDSNKLKFTPASSATGSPYATFAFKVTDSTDGESAAAYTITINVTAATTTTSTTTTTTTATTTTTTTTTTASTTTTVTTTTGTSTAASTTTTAVTTAAATTAAVTSTAATTSVAATTAAVTTAASDATRFNLMAAMAVILASLM